jgi:hypothetical protein
VSVSFGDKIIHKINELRYIRHPFFRAPVHKTG